MTVTAVHRPEEVLLAFARALRAAGVAVTADRERTYLEAVAEVGLQEAPTYWAGRATLCGSPADLERYDQVYAAWFGLQRAAERARSERQPALAQAALEPGAAEARDAADPEEDGVRAQASATEVLRHRDLATLSAAERVRLAVLFARLDPRAPRRTAPRRVPSRRGAVDARRTLRTQLRQLGEPGPVAWRHRGTRARRVVLLVDVSGSMSGYADALLRLAHAYAANGVPVEVFTLGTRLTHVTRPLRQRDPERALVACGTVVPDWSGGTRLAQGMRVFLDRWGRRGMARGAVVVVFSDGWEREAPEALGEQMRRLAGVAHRVIWVNPHRGKPGYAPVQQGIMAALPHVDDFLAGHSMATFEELVEVVAHA